jgi:3-oxoacyl-[acyl-carrier protein] reductase
MLVGGSGEAGMSLRLEGKIAIVIGAARGIGSGVVEVFLEEGASVVLVDIDEGLGRATADSLSAKGEVSFHRADMASRADMQAMADSVLARHGRIDVLCQVAGIYPDHVIEEIAEAEWDHVLAVNLKGPFLAIQACLPAMKARRYGRIVLTSSITGPRVAFPGHAHYASSKAGMIGLIRSAALEAAPWGITVNGVEPGNVETENLRRERGPAHMEMMARAVPLGRLATPREIGQACAFLASDHAAYITGQTILLDGGQILPEAKV